MNDRDRALVESIEAGRERWIELTRDLVNCDSGTYNKNEADRAGDILAAELIALGFEVERSRQATFGDHVIGRKAGSGDARLLFVGHFDTVFPPGTVAERPFTIDGDRATGPGVYDMKSGIVVLLAALQALREHAPDFWNETTLTAIFNSDEEVLSPTSGPIIAAEARRADTVCILEPARPGGAYTYIRKGAGMFRLDITGRAAHSGAQPHLGRSAIVELARKVLLLTDVARPDIGTTVNVGVVAGGERANVVPDHASCQFDLRALTHAEAARAQQEFKEIAALQFVPDTTTTYSGKVHFPPLPERAVNVRLFELVQTAGEKLGLTLASTVSGGGSDGNTAGQLAPVIDGMGARGDGAHTDHEYIELDSITERASVLALFLVDWPNHRESIAALNAHDIDELRTAYEQGLEE